MRPISSATPTPSFQIAGAAQQVAPLLRFDQINSQQVLQAARQVLFQYQQQWPIGPDPCGVVLTLAGQAQGHGGPGRVVFTAPILLPQEQYVAMEWIRGRANRSSSPRLRMPRRAPSPPWAEGPA